MAHLKKEKNSTPIFLFGCCINPGRDYGRGGWREITGDFQCKQLLGFVPLCWATMRSKPGAEKDSRLDGEKERNGVRRWGFLNVPSSSSSSLPHSTPAAWPRQSHRHSLLCSFVISSVSFPHTSPPFAQRCAKKRRNLQNQLRKRAAGLYPLSTSECMNTDWKRLSIACR